MTSPTNPMRKIALTGGLLYLATFVASLPQLAFFADIIDKRDFVRGIGSTTPVLWGSLLEVVTAGAGIGTAVALYPMARRVSRTAALGFVASRVVEAALIIVGAVSLLSVVTLRADYAAATGAGRDALGVTAHALVSMRQWTFLLGPGVMSGVNACFLGYVMYRSRLVPRIIPTIGLIGAPVLLTSSVVTVLGGWGQVSTAGVLCGLPVAAWELSLGLWLTFKGFRSVPIASTVPAPGRDALLVG
jgi:hypothetical protein